MGVGDRRHATAALLTRKTPRTHFTGSWMGPRAGLDGCGKLRPPLGFDLRTVQPVAGRYTDYAFPAPFNSIMGRTNRMYCRKEGSRWDVSKKIPLIYLTFMEPCIARCVFYITNEMQIIQCSLLSSALYMFRAVFPPIIRSL